MSRDHESLLAELEGLAQRILHVAKLPREAMDRVALELQIDLETHRYDHRDDANYPHDPYGEFESLARLVCLDSWDPDDQEDVYLASLNAQQTYLVGAWNFVTIARAVSLQSEPFKGAPTS